MRANSTVVNSLIWKVGERIMVQGIGLVVQVILARLLMPEDFACLAIITVIINFLGLFVQSGLSVAVVQKKEITDVDVSTLTTVSLFVALVLYVTLFFLAPFINSWYNVGNLICPIRVMGMSLFLYSFNSIQTGLLQRKMMFRTIFIRSLFAIPIASIIGISMAYLGFGIWSLIAYSISNLLIVVAFMNMIPDIRPRFGFSLRSAKELYSFSVKILGTSLICASGDTIRTLVIGKFYTPNQLAYFDRGLSYSGLVTQVVNVSLSSVLLPVMSRSQEDLVQLKNMARRSVSISAFVMIPILVMVALLSKPLVLILLSEKWLPCSFFLSIFCLLRIPSVITSCDKQVYYALGKSQIGLIFETLSLVVNLILLFVMIPYGAIVIAVSITVVEFINNFFLFIVSSKVLNYTLKERFLDLYKTVLSTSIMFILSYALKWIVVNNFLLLVLQIVVCIIVYILASFMMKDKNLAYILNRVLKIS